MLVLGTAALALGQNAPSFRSSAQVQLNDANTNAAETTPPGGTQGELFGSVSALGTGVQGIPKLPRATQQLPGTAHPIPGTGASLRVAGVIAPGFLTGTSQRLQEAPLAFHRHPGRNLASPSGDDAFTLCSTSDAGMLAQMSIGLQTDTWHTDNLTFAKRSTAVSEAILEFRPIVQLNLGSPPSGHGTDSLRSEYFLELRYTPTQQTLLGAGTSRMLQRLAGEIGRASPVLSSTVRFEYDENIFALRGDGTVEESSTVTEVSPIIEYSLSAKTTVHAEATWRRLATQASSTNRSEYILETGIATAKTPKTTIGMGLEFGHIPFDQARFGAQDYQQAYASMAWQASPKIRFQTRAGIEIREFDQPTPKPARVTPVARMILNWSPNGNTQFNAGFMVRNQPSVSKVGATFQEIRFGTDARYQVGRNIYVSGEVALIQRNYDSGTRELETVVRPALGFRADRNRILNSLNVEIYYQFRRLDSNQPGADRDRNIFGIESTLYF